MHELSITENLLNMVINYAEGAGAHKILCVYISIGIFSSIIDDSVHFYWDFIKKDTIAEWSSLQIERNKKKKRCFCCGNITFVSSIDSYICENCGSEYIDFIEGDEFILKSMEVE